MGPGGSGQRGQNEPALCAVFWSQRPCLCTACVCTAAVGQSPAGCPCLGGFSPRTSSADGQCAVSLLGRARVSTESTQRLGIMADALTAEGLAALPSSSAEESDVSSRTSGSSPGPGNGTGVFIPVSVDPPLPCVGPGSVLVASMPAYLLPGFPPRCCCCCCCRPASWMAAQ